MRTCSNDVDKLYVEPLRPFKCYLNYKELFQKILKYEKENPIPWHDGECLAVVGLTCSVEMHESFLFYYDHIEYTLPMHLLHTPTIKWVRQSEWIRRCERERDHFQKAASIWMDGSHQFYVLKSLWLDFAKKWETLIFILYYFFPPSLFFMLSHWSSGDPLHSLESPWHEFSQKESTSSKVRLLCCG